MRKERRFDVDSTDCAIGDERTAARAMGVEDRPASGRRAQVADKQPAGTALKIGAATAPAAASVAAATDEAAAACGGFGSLAGI
jgi:hypothetical protein